MTVRKLIELLTNVDQDLEVMVPLNYELKEYDNLENVIVNTSSIDGSVYIWLDPEDE